MLEWMVYIFVVTLTLTVAALAAEQALRLQRLTTRWVWVTAILASLVLPTIISSVSIQVPSLGASDAPSRVLILRNATSLPLTMLPTSHLPPASSHVGGLSLDARLRIGWLIASGALLLLLGASALQLLFKRRRWSRAMVAGVSVYIAPGVGPAIAGLLRPRIVLPPWVLESSPACQALVIAHEQSHLAARDPLLLTLAVCLLVFMPWNLPLWWQLRQLRRAIEVDCDARVLRAGHDVNGYGETLIEVGRLQSGFLGKVAAMSESRAFLEQRISIMVRKPPGWWRRPAALLGLASVCLIAVAAQVSPPNSGRDGDLQAGLASNPAAAARAVAAVDPAVYAGYVGHYQFDEDVVMSVWRDGERLFSRLTGQQPVEIFPSSRTEYFARVVNAQVTFQTDAHGRATALIVHQAGMNHTAPRMDDRLAQQIEDALSAHVQSQAPYPGTEAALRRYYAGLLAGKPTYEELSPTVAEYTHPMEEQLVAVAKQYGAIQSVEFRGVGSQGWDIYDVRHEHGTLTWRIALSHDGKIRGVLAQDGP